MSEERQSELIENVQCQKAVEKLFFIPLLVITLPSSFCHSVGLLCHSVGLLCHSVPDTESIYKVKIPACAGMTRGGKWA